MRGVSHVALVTGDLAALRVFYADVFGAQSAYGGADDAERGGPAFLRVGDLVLHVFERSECPLGAIDDATASVAFRRGRVDHVALEASSSAEFERVRERLVERGCSDGRVVDFGPLVSVFGVDPDGSAIEVSLPRPPDWRPPFPLEDPGSVSRSR